jgi:integrase
MAGETDPELREALERSRGNAVATFVIEKGHDPLVVQRMLRHSHVDMTMHYIHNSHKGRAAQADFTQRFLPEGERVPKRVREPL